MLDNVQPIIAVAFARNADTQMVSDFLQASGFRVVSLDEAAHSPDFADLFVLDSSCVRKAPWVLEKKKTSQVFLPVLVGIYENEQAESYLDRGYDSCLSLPFGKSQLLSTINLLLRLRSQSRKILMLAENRYMAMFEATGTATIVVNPDATIAMANRECEKVTLYKPEELVGTPWINYVAPESLGQMLEYFRLRMKEPKKAPMQYETRLVDKSGRVRNAILSVGYLPMTGQNIVSIVDVTSLRQAQEALMRKESLFHDMFEKHTAIKLLMDPDDGRIINVNLAAERFYGWPRETLRTMNISDINVLSAEQLKAKMEKVRRRERSHFEFRHRRADGSVRDVAVYSSMIQFDGKDLLYSIIHDITEQKNAQSRYEMLFAAIEQASDAVIVTDFQGNIQYVNPAFAKITGYSAGEVLGKNPRILKSGHHDSEFYQELWSTISSGGVWQGNLVNRRKNGEMYTEEAVISPVRGQDGSIEKYVAVKRDITEKLQSEKKQSALEEQLRQSQRMEAMGQLAGGVAHDFNNILGVILGYAEMLQSALPETDPLQADVREILNAARRASDLTRQLLLFSRRQPARLQLLVIDDVVLEMKRMLARLIGEDIALETDLQSAPYCVLADRTQLEQVILNLAVNARDAMPRGGRLSIRTRVLNAEDAKKMFAVVSVQDTGYGIAPEIRDRIFEPFFTTKEVGKGTGLGLSTVYGIVNQAYGHIDVESELGRGTVFHVYWPVAEQEQQKTEQSFPGSLLREEPGDGLRVLVVEDEESLRRLLERILKKVGFVVRSADSGEAAIALAHNEKWIPDVLLTDMVMPGINGIDTARALQALHPNLQVVYMSGYVREHPIEKELGEKAHFLQKPFCAEELVRLMLSLKT